MLFEFRALLSLQRAKRVQGEILGVLFVSAH
jgi:hypothetical protein